MKEINAVIFDMDGVIFDSENLVIRCWNKVAERYGIPGVEETLLRCIGKRQTETRQIFLDQYGEDFPFDHYEKEVLEEFLQGIARGELLVKPGTQQLLAFLKGKGIPMAIASSTRSVHVREELADADLLDFFQEVVGGEMVTNGKPAPDIFLAAARRLGVLPETCFVIEDSPTGIRAACEAGMRPVMVPDVIQPDEETRGLAEVVLPSLTEARGYIEGALAGALAPAVVFYGDSNTYGYDPRGWGDRYPASVRWVDRVAAELPDDREVLNAGMNGREIPRLTDWDKAELDRLLDASGRPVLLVIMLGTNDILLTGRPEAERAVRRMDLLLGDLTDPGKRQDLPWLVLIIPPALKFREEGTVFRKYEEESRRLSEGYRQLGEKYGIPVMDASVWDLAMGYDQVHLSEEGHRQFAKEFLNTPFIRGMINTCRAI